MFYPWKQFSGIFSLKLTAPGEVDKNGTIEDEPREIFGAYFINTIYVYMLYIVNQKFFEFERVYVFGFSYLM